MEPMEPKRVKVEVVTAGASKAKAKTAGKAKAVSKSTPKSTPDAPKTKLGPAWMLTTNEAQKRRYAAIEAVRSLSIPSIDPPPLCFRTHL